MNIRAHNLIVVLQEGCRRMFEKIKEIDTEICVHDILEFGSVEISENSVRIRYLGSIENSYELTCEHLIEQDAYIVSINKKESKVETIHAYVENGDLVKCCNCETKMLLPRGAEVCPKCKKEGCLSWIEDQPQECGYDELIKLHYNIKRCNELEPEQYLSEETIKNINN